MKNRLISMLLAISILASLCTVVSAEDGLLHNFSRTCTYTQGQFKDVSALDWFAPGIQSAFELGLVKGNSYNTFNPGGNLTVAEALVIACRMHSIYNGTGSYFTQGSPWYQVYVDYAVQNSIINRGQFNYTAPVTREQFAYIMCNALPADEMNAINTVSSLPDVSEQSIYGAFIFRLYRAGVLTGNDSYGTYSPTTTIQRSAVATIIARLVDKSLRMTFTLKQAPPSVTEVQLAGRTIISVGESTTWTATTLPSDVPTTVTWSAGNPSVATVTQNGTITGHKVGQCHITATASNGVKKTVMITVAAQSITYKPVAQAALVEVAETLYFDLYFETTGFPEEFNISIMTEDESVARVAWDDLEDASQPWRIRIYGVSVGSTFMHISNDVTNQSIRIGITVIDPYAQTSSTPYVPTPSYDPVYGKFLTARFPLYLYSNDGRTFLGKLTTNKYDSDSISNTYGTYGSKYSSYSIFNEYGKYGSAYSSYSAFDKYATDPPIIVDSSGNFIGYLTANEYKANGITYSKLMSYLNMFYQ